MSQSELSPEGEPNKPYDDGYWDCCVLLSYVAGGFEQAYGISRAMLRALRDLAARNTLAPNEYRAGFDQRLEEFDNEGKEVRPTSKDRTHFWA